MKTMETPKEWMPDESRKLYITSDMDVLINFNQYNETRGGLIVDHQNKQFALWAGQGMGPDTGHAERTSMKRIVARAKELRERGYAEGVPSNEYARTSLFHHLPHSEQKSIAEPRTEKTAPPHFMKRQGFGGPVKSDEKRDSIAAAKSVLERLGEAGIEVSWNRDEFQRVLKYAEKLNKMADDIESVRKLGEALKEKQRENEALKKDVTDTVLKDIADRLEQIKEFIPLKNSGDRQSVLWFRDEEGRSTNFGITRTNGGDGERIKFVEFDHYTDDNRMALNEIYDFTSMELDDHSWKNHGAPLYSVDKDVLGFKDDFIDAVRENLQSRYDTLEQKNNRLLLSLAEKEKSDQAQKNLGESADTIEEDFRNLDRSLRFNANFEIPSEKLGADVSVFPGSTGKSGMGIRHLIEDRYRNDKLSQEQIAALTVLVLDCVRNGEITRDSENRCEITRGGIVAIVRKDFDDEEKNWILTGFAYNEKSDIEKNREATEAIQTVIARYDQSPDYSYFRSQVGAVISSLDSNITWEDSLVNRKTPRLMKAMKETSLRDAENKPLLDRICDALEANGFGMRWGDESFDYQYKWNGDAYLVSKTFTTDAKELLGSIINEMESFDPDEFAKEIWESNIEDLESISDEYFDMAYALEQDMQKTLPSLKDLQHEIEYGKDLYADLKTVVRAFRNENFSAIKTCDGYEPGLSARKGAWEMSKGGYGQAWQIYFTDKNGTKSEFCSQMKGLSQPVVITNYQYVRDGGLSPFKALASVRDAVSEDGHANFPQLDEPTAVQYQKHLDAEIYGMVGFTGDWNEEGRLVYSDEKIENEGLLFEVKDILESSQLPVTGDIAEEIAYAVCDRTNAVIYAWEAGEITESQLRGDTVKVTAKAEDRIYSWVITGYEEFSDADRINILLGASITDALAEHGITMSEYEDQDYENIRMEIVDSAMACWKENKLSKFKHEMMPEINYSVRTDDVGGCVITDLGTGRDVYLQPGDEANRMLDEYERGEMPDSILSEYFVSENGGQQKDMRKEPDKAFSAEWLERELGEYGFSVDMDEKNLRIGYTTDAGFDCIVDSLGFNGADDLKEKFLDLADNFKKDSFVRENEYDTSTEEEIDELEGIADDVSLFLKKTSESIRSMDAPKPHFMKRTKDVTEDDYEKHLSGFYKHETTFENAVEENLYLAGHEYNGRELTRDDIEGAAQAGTLGEIIRQCDPVKFAVGYDEYIREYLPERDRENIQDMIEILESQGLTATADFENNGFQIGFIDDDGNELDVASVGFEDSSDLAEKLVAISGDFDSEEFADDLDNGDTKYEDYTVTNDGYKNYLEFCRCIADTGTIAEDVAKIMTDWHGMQLLTKDFLDDHLCRNYIVESGYDREEYKGKIFDDCNKNFDPLMEISGACGFDAEQMATVFREWNGTDIFSKEFMENYFEEVLEMEKDMTSRQKLVDAGNAISDALSDAADEIRAKYLYRSQSLVRNGIVYGIAYDGRILLNPDAFPFLDEKGINERDAMLGDSVKVLSETLPHEWTHLWDEYTMRTNPELWDKWTKIVRDTRAYDRLKHSMEYKKEIDACKTEKERTDYIASELHARAAGKFGKKILERIARENGKITKDTMKRWMYEANIYVAEELGLIDEIGFSAERVPSAREIIADARRLDASTVDWNLVELANRGDDYRHAVYDLAKYGLPRKTENEIMAEAQGIRVGLESKREKDAEVVKKMLANPFKDLVGGKQITRLDLVSEYMEKKLGEVFTPAEMQKDGVNDEMKPKAERAKTVTLKLRNGRKFRITHEGSETCSFHLLDKRTGEYTALGEPLKITGGEDWRKTVAEKAAEKIIDAGGLDSDALVDFEMRKSSRTETRDPKPITVREFNSFLGTKYADSAEMVRKTGIESLERAMRTVAQTALLEDWQKGAGAPLSALREKSGDRADRIESLARKTAEDIVFGKYTGLTYRAAAERLTAETRSREGAPSASYKTSPELQKMAEKIKARSVEDLKRKAVSATHRFSVGAALEERNKKQAKAAPSKEAWTQER